MKAATLHRGAIGDRLGRLEGMNMQPHERPLGQRIVRGFLRLLTVAFILGLLGLVAYLASERNARTYSFTLQGDQLVVMKGRMLPTGADPWVPTDPALLDAYAPVPLDGTKVEVELLNRHFADRDELDRTLFTILERLARPRLQSDDPKQLERGAYYLRRAQKLSGITQEQRRTLESLRSDIALYLARMKLDQARQILADALSQLQIAATGQNRNAARANQLAAEIGEPARQFEEALRRALGSLPLTAPQAPEPNARPQAQPLAPDAGAVRTDSQTQERSPPPEAPAAPSVEPPPPSYSDGP